MASTSPSPSKSRRSPLETRAALEALSRDALIEEATRTGIPNAAVLTRPEIVDEILLRETPDRADPNLRTIRGLFGVARDLLARVVEKKLHLPETAALLRSIPVEAKEADAHAPAVPTVTLAEIYASQGHIERAAETLSRVLTLEPDHALAKSLMQKLAGDTASTSANDVAGNENRPIVPDDFPLPTRYDVNECVALPVDPTTVFVYWEVRAHTKTFAEGKRPGGRFVLQVVEVEPTWDGPKVSERVVEVLSDFGDYFLRDLKVRSAIRIAIGWHHEGTFYPIAHSPTFERPSAASFSGSETGSGAKGALHQWKRWTTHGTYALSKEDQDAMSVEHALMTFQHRQRSRETPGSRKLGSS